MDSNIERFARIERMADDMFRPYREVYEEKQAIQTRLTMFIKKPTPATSTVAPADDIEDPQPSTIDFYIAFPVDILNFDKSSPFFIDHRNVFLPSFYILAEFY
ncbi:Hypothetical predicted protein [Octopus vulgaris]|uniref:Uncharacterized protein n=1 Tax=Octopus vulgaris TaxID=6645 RepID=A0AA36F0W1_OCTVU|nr:Hypothetical predicted protein [Octopus vulgaris]